MKYKPLYVGLSLMLILGVLLTACAPATQAPAVEAPEEPAGEEVTYDFAAALAAMPLPAAAVEVREAIRICEGNPQCDYRVHDDGITSFSVMPLRIIAAVGALIFAGTMLASLFFLWVWATHSQAMVPGWASTVLPMLFLGGMIGWNGQQEFETDDFIEQVGQTLRNIVEVLAEAGARPEHLVRLTWYVTDRDEYVGRLKELGPVYRAALGSHFPAMALVQVVALVERRAKVEIEATAVVPE